MKQRFPIFGTLFTLLTIAALCGLGNWQLQRLEWKTGILKKLEAEYAKDAKNTPLALNQLDNNAEYKRGTLKGVYEYDKEIRVGPRSFDNTPGFHVLTPLRLEDGSYILVNRGWASQSWRKEKTGTENTNATGLLRQPDDKNAFSAVNTPEKDEWHYVDPQEIATAKNITRIHTHVLYLENEDQDNSYPIALNARPNIPNDHLQYAIFWFIMAAVLAVIYVLRFFRK